MDWRRFDRDHPMDDARIGYPLVRDRYQFFHSWRAELGHLSQPFVEYLHRGLHKNLARCLVHRGAPKPVFCAIGKLFGNSVVSWPAMVVGDRMLVGGA